MNSEEIRIAKIFGLSSGKMLPGVSAQSLIIYHAHLNKHLTFPIKALYAQEVAPFKTTRWDMKVIGLLDPETAGALEFYGLLCEGYRGKQLSQVPLADIEVVKRDDNHTLVDDYKTWFWNYR